MTKDSDGWRAALMRGILSVHNEAFPLLPDLSCALIGLFCLNAWGRGLQTLPSELVGFHRDLSYAVKEYKMVPDPYLLFS